MVENINFFSRLSFFLKANNAHGIHSPFVYQLLTEGLYSSSIRNRNKNLQSLLRILSHLKPAKMTESGMPETWQKEICLLLPNLQYSKGAPEFVYFHRPSTAVGQLLDQLKTPEASMFVYINNLGNSQKSRALWKTFSEHTHVLQSLDFFDFGLLFFRNTQAEQHFKLRRYSLF